MQFAIRDIAFRFFFPRGVFSARITHITNRTDQCRCLYCFGHGSPIACSVDAKEQARVSTSYPELMASEDETRPDPGTGQVKSGMHLQKGCWWHMKRFLDADRHMQIRIECDAKGLQIECEV